MEHGTIYYDTAVGSVEFAPLFRNRGLKSQPVARLPADFAVLGRGKAGAAWPIGVERKTLSDLCSSLTRDRLFGTQLPRMLKEYERIWLLVEGVWRCGKDDCVEVWGWDQATQKRGWVPARTSSLTWSALQKWLMTWDEMGGGKVRRWRTSTDLESVEWLAALLSWWQGKKYEAHGGHVAIEQDTKMPSAAHVLLHRPNGVQEMAFSIPGLGAKTALKVGRYFDSRIEMVMASRDEWMKAGLSRNAADKVWRRLRENVR